MGQYHDGRDEMRDGAPAEARSGGGPRRPNAVVAFTVAGIVLIALALALVGNNVLHDRAAAERCAEALDGVDAQMAPYALTDYAAPSGKLASAQVGDRSYVGVIEMPALGLRLPVQSSWTEENVAFAPALYVGAPSTRHLIVGGMNYPSQFGRISELADGDAVVFTDMANRAYRYRVATVETVDSGDWGAIEGDVDEGLSLFANTFSGMQTTVVRCLPDK